MAPPASSTHRACDHCRRRKTKCDSNTPCSNCKNSELPCQYTGFPQKRGPKTPRTRSDRVLRRGRQLEPISIFDPTPTPTQSLASHADFSQGHLSSPSLDLESPVPPAPSIASVPLVQLTSPPQLISLATSSLWTSSTTSPAGPDWLQDICSRPPSLQDRLTGIHATLLAALEASLPYLSTRDIVHQCIDLFMQYTFPASPIIHEPTVRSHASAFFPLTPCSPPKSIFEIDNNSNGSGHDRAHTFSRARDLSLLTALCASVAAVMPDCLLAFRHTVIKPFLQASRDVFRVIEDYDVQHVSASSLIIRILQSTALQNATGRPELAWHLLGQASLLSLRLGLYQETSLQNVADPVERQLLRSCFCTLYAADNASCAVGNRESILRDDCFPGGRTTALYATANHATCLMNGERQSPTLTAASLEEKLRCGIELMPRLWSAAASLINRMSMPSQPINDEEDSLIQAYLEFSAILDDLPTWLQTSSLIAAEMRRGAVNDDNSSTELDVYQDTAFWVQRCTIVMSFNCARLLILQKCIETGRCNIMGMTNAALPVQMKKIDMVLDFLRELEEIPFVYHQIKGEPSVERVRCVGSILLEMIQTASNEIILGRARSCFARLMEILAKLDSKASDELASGTIANMQDTQVLPL